MLKMKRVVTFNGLSKSPIFQGQNSFLILFLDSFVHCVLTINVLSLTLLRFMTPSLTQLCVPVFVDSFVCIFFFSSPI